MLTKKIQFAKARLVIILPMVTNDDREGRFV